MIWPPKKLDCFSSWFDGALKRAQAKDASIERVTPHGLRHVASELLVNAGGERESGGDSDGSCVGDYDPRYLQ